MLLHSERLSFAFLLLFLEAFVLLHIHTRARSLAGDTGESGLAGRAP